MKKHLSFGKFWHFSFDIAFVFPAWAFARWLFLLDGTQSISLIHVPALLIFAASFIAPFMLGKIYAVLWTHSFVKDTYRLILACLAGCIIFPVINYLFYLSLPSAFTILASLIFSLFAILSRMLSRDYFSRMISPAKHSGFFTVGELPKERKILIIGAGEAGRLVLSEYHRKGIDHHIAGFVDDDPKKVGMIINGKQVFAPTEKIPQVIEPHGVNEIILAFPSAPKKEVTRVVQLIRKASPTIPIKILPSHTKLFENPLTPDIREIGIADLLEREETQLDASSIEKMLVGKNILITGAGGSIGSEICKQLFKFPIASLIAVGKGEHSIYQLARRLFDYQEFLQEKRDIAFRIADVRNSKMMEKIFREFSPHLVFHAAAHKHVPLMEFNEAEAVLNNIVGTNTLLDTAMNSLVERFILISTDKAVCPTSVMGATKRAAEIIVQNYASKGISASIVRFGNVIGSRGSVIPLFREQIERGGPVTVTHPDITRFFMSIPEAALLVLNASAYAKGGEIFVLDMGRQYRVMEIAESLIRLYGLEPHKDIEIQITGLRPGEKMFEELSYDGKLEPTENRKIFRLTHNAPHAHGDNLNQFLSEIQSLPDKCPAEIRKMLQMIVPEYQFNSEELERRNNRRFIS